MEAYIMGPAGSTEKYLVMVLESAYDNYTLQEIEHIICNNWQVHTVLVRQADDMVGVNHIYIVDSNGPRRWDNE